jgi:hypothetical protein
VILTIHDILDNYDYNTEDLYEESFVENSEVNSKKMHMVWSLYDFQIPSNKFESLEKALKQIEGVTSVELDNVKMK